MESYTLASLPVEVLEQILSFDDCAHAIVLWCCGDRLLNVKLARGAVRQMIMKDQMETSRSRWPVFLTKLRGLKRLVIIRAGLTLHSVEVIRNGLKSLSPTLEHLELDFIWALESLFEPQFLEKFTLKPDRSAPLAHCYSYSIAYGRLRTNTTGMWNLKTHFPNLKTLIINPTPRRHDEIRREQSIFCDVDFLALPDSLTHLAFQSSYTHLPPLVSDSWNLAWIPRGLTTLRINFCIVDMTASDVLQFRFSSSEVQKLPPGLTCLQEIKLAKLDNSERPNNLQEFIAALPSSITRFNNDEWSQGFPFLPHLQGLQIHLRHPPSMYDSLPKTLTRISLPEPVPNLPSSITHMSVMHTINWKVQMQNHSNDGTLPFPIQLRTLVLRSVLPPETFVLLPTTLSSLEACVPDGDTMTTLPYIPPNLTKLKWHLVRQHAYSAATVSPRLISQLPESLTTLEVPVLFQPPILDDLVPGVPRNIRELVFLNPIRQSEQYPGLLPASCFQHLPTGLTSLALEAHIDPAYWKLLPETLESFYISPLFHSSVEVISDGVFGLLPHKLKHLNVSHRHCHGDQLKYLPRTLKTLDSSGRLLRISHLHGQHLSELPPKLMGISILVEEETHQLVQEDVLKLPATLIHKESTFGSPLDEWRQQQRIEWYKRSM